MRKPALLLLSSMTLCMQAIFPLANADEGPSMPQESMQNSQPAEQPPAAPFKAFTGKVTKNKVRLRQQANLDSPILKELNQGDLLIVVSETDDFYAVQPPNGIKAYVFRPYVLDNVVEASRVNVRLEPDTEAPIIAQLSAGDRVDGIVSPLNSKWLEITPPPSARFFVAKDYIEKLGDPTLMATIEKRREEVNILLNSTYLVSQSEMQKAFPEINLDGIYANYNKVIKDYQDFPEQVARARELISILQENYTQKKIAFLETKAKMAQDDWLDKNTQLTEQMKAQQQRLAQLEQQLQKQNSVKNNTGVKLGDMYAGPVKAISDKMATWLPIEQTIYQSWSAQNNNRPQDEFYQEQRQQAIAIKGIIEPYSRVIKNKPGDYMLVNQSSHLPIAYLYSTIVNLQDRIGHEVTIYAVPRDNNNFAFPAYFVLSLE